MVLPAIIGAIGIGFLGWLGINIASTVVYWGSAVAGLFIIGYALKWFLDEDPFPITENNTLNNILYLVYSAGLGFVAFNLIQKAFLLFGITSALAAALLAVGMIMFSPGFILGGLVSVFNLVAGILGGE